MKRHAKLFLHLTLAVTLAILPGCLMGSPLAAISGEPYGMVIDDVKALQGRKGRIWSKAPFFAAIDIPFAFCLDTAFLPISLLAWGISALSSSDEDEVWAKRREDDEDEDEDEDEDAADAADDDQEDSSD